MLKGNDDRIEQGRALVDAVNEIRRLLHLIPLERRQVSVVRVPPRPTPGVAPHGILAAVIAATRRFSNIRMSVNCSRAVLAELSARRRENPKSALQLLNRDCTNYNFILFKDIFSRDSRYTRYPLSRFSVITLQMTMSSWTVLPPERQA
jgi:hypothetical protein